MTLPSTFENLVSPGWVDSRKGVEEVLDAGEVSGAPTFDNAACTGLWDTFDPPSGDETRDDIRSRWRTAQTICAECPVRARCSEWFNSLPEDHRPGGVVAGEIRSHLPGRRRNAA